MTLQLAVLALDPDGYLRRVLSQVKIPEEWSLQFQDSGKTKAGARALHQTEVLIVRTEPVGRTELEAAPRLKLIQKFGRRTENIDLEAATEHGIRVAVMPLEHGIWVAEHAIMLMLALTKKLLPAHQGVKAGVNPQKIEPFRTSQSKSVYNWTFLDGRGALYRKVLGIVGLGEIGTEVAIRARGFGMSLVYCNPPAFRLAPRAESELEVTYQPLPELLSQSDYVTLHTPHTPETEGLMGRSQFRMMKPSAYFINCSRGGVVDEEALCDALAARQIAGAGLDVYQFEPLPPESALLRLDNVVMTPHNAGGPLETLAAEGTELIGRILSSIEADSGESSREVRMVHPV